MGTTQIAETRDAKATQTCLSEGTPGAVVGWEQIERVAWQDCDLAQCDACPISNFGPQAAQTVHIPVETGSRSARLNPGRKGKQKGTVRDSPTKCAAPCRSIIIFGVTILEDPAVTATS